MNRHFVEILRGLSDAGAEYLIIGAQALSAHGYVRATKDLDIWIRPSRENAQRVWIALARFGAPLENLSMDDLTTPGTIFQIGIDPIRIDVLTAVAGLGFDEAWSGRTTIAYEGLDLPYLSKADLIRSKRAAGRPQDLIDIENLERLG